MTEQPILRVGGVSKTFGATRALRDVNLSFPAGSVTALLGENGSGKSTLVKILAGLLQPDDEGASVEVAGRRLPSPLTPESSRQAGFAFVHQDLGLVDELTVADNVALSYGFLAAATAPVRRRAERQRTGRLLGRFGVDADPDWLVADLSPSQKTMLAVARAFGAADESFTRVVVLDEPTAALTAESVERVLEAIRQARRDGTAVILVSHRLEEVRQIADRTAVLRDGEVVAEQSLEGLSAERLIELMLGHRLARATEATQARTPANERPAAQAVLSARGLSGPRLRDVDLELYPGEVLGVAGLQGCGRSELARVVAGVQRPLAGEVTIGTWHTNGFRGPHEAIAAGIVCVPQDRRAAGVILDLSLRENLTLGDLAPVRRGLSLSRTKERDEARRLIEQFDIRPGDPELALRHFSGGNQQKTAIARTLRLDPQVLVLDEPTQGIDIGARDEIGRLVRDLCSRGVAVLLASSDGDELIELADRVLVLDRGAVSTTLGRGELTRERLALATGAGKVTA